MVAEVVHGTPYRFSDPARFSLAHGGKDRHPYPVPLKVYDRTIEVMKSAVHKAKLGHTEEIAALRRLDEQARRLERNASGPSVEALIAEERTLSHSYGGRSVFGLEPAASGAGHRNPQSSRPAGPAESTPPLRKPSTTTSPGQMHLRQTPVASGCRTVTGPIRRLSRRG
jgi:hypothetical protein